MVEIYILYSIFVQVSIKMQFHYTNPVTVEKKQLTENGQKEFGCNITPTLC